MRTGVRGWVDNQVEVGPLLDELQYVMDDGAYKALLAQVEGSDLPPEAAIASVVDAYVRLCC